MWQEDIITDWFLRAGDIALGLFERAQVNIKKDMSLVTEGDLAIEKYIENRIKEMPGEHFLIGEESVSGRAENYIQGAMKGSTYVLDPIDGTINYASGLELWGISIGWMQGGQLREGGIYLPVLGELYMTMGGRTILKKIANGAVLGSRVLGDAEGLHDDGAILSVTQNITKQSIINLPNPIHSVAVAVYPLVNLLRGRYMGYVAKVKLWDLAGGLPMIHGAGLECRLWNGKNLGLGVQGDVYQLDPGHEQRWALRDYVVFCKPGRFGRITGGIQRVPAV